MIAIAKRLNWQINSWNTSSKYYKSKINIDIIDMLYTIYYIIIKLNVIWHNKMQWDIKIYIKYNINLWSVKWGIIWKIMIEFYSMYTIK
jgi:hypothetical protein